MNTKKRIQTVAERVEAALTLHRVHNPGVPLSVASLARAAGVSRANLYSSHPKLIEEIKSLGPIREAKRRVANSSNQMEILRKENDRLRLVNKALLLINVELRRDLTKLMRRLPSPKAKP